jgi:hypothetical protein
LKANAYTVGNDIVFGTGRFAPETRVVRRLIAYELVHVLQQASGTPSMLQRQSSQDDVAELERQLQKKMSERAMLGRMLDKSQKDFAANVLRRRVYTGSQKEQAKLKAGAQGDLQTTVPVDVLKNKIDVVRTKDGFTLTVRIELSYLGLKEAEGKSKADTAIPLIEKALSEAWTIDLTEGHYAGNKFKLKPKLEFRSNSRRRNERALQFVVRRVARGDSQAEWAHGEISFNPAHLQSDRVIIAAHEMYHLFGWIVDSYYIPKKTAKKGPSAKYVVGRTDAAGRADLLGMVDPKRLREWLDRGLISQTDFDRQTRAQAKVWQEDVQQILYALGVPPNSGKKDTRRDPNSPDFDPSEALRTEEAEIKQRLVDLEGETERYEEIADSVQKAERAIQLDGEIAALQKKIAGLKAAGRKGAVKP